MTRNTNNKEIIEIKPVEIVEVTDIVENDKIIEIQDVEILISKEEAIELTKDIQSTTSALYVLIKKAHDEKIWIAMGYDSWTSYIENEFDFSRARSYQLINQAKVIEEINEASGVDLFITEREARSIKKRLPEITEKLQNVRNENLSENEARERAVEIIEESGENVDNSERYSGGNGENSHGEGREDNSTMEEWKPEGIDMDRMKRMLNDNDKRKFNDLLITLKMINEVANPMLFGKTLRESSQELEEFIQAANQAHEWIDKLLDEIE